MAAKMVRKQIKWASKKRNSAKRKWKTKWVMVPVGKTITGGPQSAPQK